MIRKMLLALFLRMNEVIDDLLFYSALFFFVSWPWPLILKNKDMAMFVFCFPYVIGMFFIVRVINRGLIALARMMPRN